MNRKQFAHTIRAAGVAMSVKELIVIGSQAFHASAQDHIAEVNQSAESDIAAFDDPDGKLADILDGSIGELSAFQEEYGYYAQGVSITTAILPEGSRDRLVPFSSPDTNGITAYCRELHDLWISKAMAGREKDQKFCAALAYKMLVRAKVLQERLATITDQPAEKIALAKGWIDRMAR